MNLKIKTKIKLKNIKNLYKITENTFFLNLRFSVDIKMDLFKPHFNYQDLKKKLENNSEPSLYKSTIWI